MLKYVCKHKKNPYMFRSFSFDHPQGAICRALCRYCNVFSWFAFIEFYLIFLFKLMFRVAQSSRWFSYGIREWFTESLTLHVILLVLVALFLYLTQAYWHSLSSISLVCCFFCQRTQRVLWPRPTHSHSKTAPLYPSVPSPRLPHTRYHSIPN
jgi:hypothetical protein